MLDIIRHSPYSLFFWPCPVHICHTSGLHLSTPHTPWNFTCPHLYFFRPTLVKTSNSLGLPLFTHVILGLPLSASVISWAFPCLHLSLIGPSPFHISNSLELHLSSHAIPWAFTRHICLPMGLHLHTLVIHLALTCPHLSLLGRSHVHLQLQWSHQCGKGGDPRPVCHQGAPRLYCQCNVRLTQVMIGEDLAMDTANSVLMRADDQVFLLQKCEGRPRCSHVSRFCEMLLPAGVPCL